MFALYALVSLYDSPTKRFHDENPFVIKASLFFPFPGFKVRFYSVNSSGRLSFFFLVRNADENLITKNEIKVLSSHIVCFLSVMLHLEHEQCID